MSVMAPVLGTGSQGEALAIVRTLMKSAIVVGLIVLAARSSCPSSYCGDSKQSFFFWASLKTPDNLRIICDTASPRRNAHVDTPPTQFL